MLCFPLEGFPRVRQHIGCDRKSIIVAQLFRRRCSIVADCKPGRLRHHSTPSHPPLQGNCQRTLEVAERRKPFMEKVRVSKIFAFCRFVMNAAGASKTGTVKAADQGVLHIAGFDERVPSLIADFCTDRFFTWHDNYDFYSSLKAGGVSYEHDNKYKLGKKFTSYCFR